MAEKLGLALSGGGFRASFYHIGVLAQMAEQGLLKHIEVISTVSGGSIIGALYYLHVKKLLESKADADITDQDYVAIMQQIEVDFLKGTQKNIRMETFSDVCANLKMTSATYSRSDRLAELYNEHFYKSVLPESDDVSHPVQMQELKIYPDGNKNFIPWEGNLTRQAKVPILVLNATTLNTGRNWQFTAQKMGEPETDEERNQVPPADRIDKKPIRLRRANSYANVSAVKNKEGLSLQNISLGHAVAASASVPGLFPPLSITGLYKETDPTKSNQIITPQLVDGGVFDNQAIEGLLQNECTCFVISDAAGQMGVENEVATNSFSVLLRVSTILQDRIRTESLKQLLSRVGGGNIAFLDLHRGLAIREIAWIDKDGNQQADTLIPAYSKNFKVDERVQSKLSLLRTDLDAFTEVEAYSLMLDGYQMSEDELRDFKLAVDHTAIKNALQQEKITWKFSAIAPWMANPDNDSDYLNQLEIAKSVPLKALRLMPYKLGVPLAFALGSLIYLGHSQIVAFFSHQITVYALILALIGWVLNIIAPKLVKIFTVLEYLRPQAQLIKRLVQVAGLLVGTLFFKFYLTMINPLFLARGEVKNLQQKP